MPRKRNVRKSIAFMKKQKQSIQSRLMQISLIVEDYVYYHMPISSNDAQSYINEVIALKAKCYDDERSLQVIEKLVRCMKGIISEHDSQNKTNTEISVDFTQTNTQTSPVYSIVDEDMTQYIEDIDVGTEHVTFDNTRDSDQYLNVNKVDNSEAGNCLAVDEAIDSNFKASVRIIENTRKTNDETNVITFNDNEIAVENKKDSENIAVVNNIGKNNETINLTLDFKEFCNENKNIETRKTNGETNFITFNDFEKVGENNKDTGNIAILDNIGKNNETIDLTQDFITNEENIETDEVYLEKAISILSVQDIILNEVDNSQNINNIPISDIRRDNKIVFNNKETRTKLEKQDQKIQQNKDFEIKAIDRKVFNDVRHKIDFNNKETRTKLDKQDQKIQYNKDFEIKTIDSKVLQANEPIIKINNSNSTNVIPNQNSLKKKRKNNNKRKVNNKKTTDNTNKQNETKRNINKKIKNVENNNSNVNNNSVINDLSWIENIRYVREVTNDEYDNILVKENFWNNYCLPDDWNDNLFDY